MEDQNDKLTIAISAQTFTKGHLGEIGVQEAHPLPRTISLCRSDQVQFIQNTKPSCSTSVPALASVAGHEMRQMRQPATNHLCVLQAIEKQHQ